MATVTLSQFTNNGFTYAPLESLRDQRKNRLLREIKVKKSLTIAEIKKICGYKSALGARKFAEDLVIANDCFCIVPNHENVKRTEARRLII